MKKMFHLLRWTSSRWEIYGHFHTQSEAESYRACLKNSEDYRVYKYKSGGG